MKNIKVLLLMLPLLFLGCRREAEGKKVIIIGVDGAGAFFSEEHTPEVYKIFNNEQSATTYSCLTSFPTISAQCWGTMLTGVSSEIHRFDNNSIAIKRNTSFPTIFKQARNQLSDAKLASIVNWGPINYGIVEEGIDVHKDSANGDDIVTQKVLDCIVSDTPDLLYVQFDSVDHAGHTSGYKSNEYYAQLKVVDGYIGQIYKKLEENNLLSKYDFIVDADHGGKEKAHGGESDDEKYVFFGITGDNIKKTDIKNMHVRDVPAICAKAMNIDPNENWDSSLMDVFK